MSQSRFISKEFASLDLKGGNLSSNNNTFEYINVDPPTTEEAVPIFSDESGKNVSLSSLSVNPLNESNFCMMQPTIIGESDPEGISMTSGSSIISILNANGSITRDINYLQAPMTFLSTSAICLSQTRINQATSISTGVSAGAYPVIKIGTQTTNIAAAGGSASFVVTGSTTNLTTPFSNVTVIPTVTTYAGAAIPYVIVSQYSNTTFTLKIFNLHPSTALTETMEISCVVITNGALLSIGA